MEAAWNFYRASDCSCCHFATLPVPLFSGGMGSPRFICAPMVGQSELPFRLMLRTAGCDLCYTPMMQRGTEGVVKILSKFIKYHETSSNISNIRKTIIKHGQTSSWPHVNRPGMRKNLPAALRKKWHDKDSPPAQKTGEEKCGVFSRNVAIPSIPPLNLGPENSC